MKRSTLTLITAPLLALTGCSGSDDAPASAPSPATSAAPAPSSTVSSPTPTPTTPKPTTSAIPASLCPPNPPKNGKLSDQGTATGRVGRTSYTYATDAGDGIYGCLAVLAVERVSGGNVGVRVLAKNNSKDNTLDLSTDPVSVRLQYGEDNITADAAGDTGGTTALLRPGQRAIGTYTFTVPQEVTRVTIVVGFTGTEDVGVWESVAVTT